jgi:perosamine synthetase
VGPFVDRFEREFAAYLGVESAVATSSGTAALHVALIVAGVGPGDEVLVSGLTFIAPVNAITYAGAHPVLIDADEATWQMDPAEVRRYLTQDCAWDGRTLRGRATGRRVSAILPVHILGHPVDMDPILELAREFGLAVVEDATESLGAAHKGRNAGTIGDVGCFSFNGNKLLTTGGGGMLVARNPDWARRAKHLTTQAKLDPLEFVHDEIGFNYRLTSVQAAIGVAQLERIGEFLEAKRRIAGRYDAFLGPGRWMARAPWAEPCWWLYTARFPGEVDTREMLRALEARGIQTRPLWQPIHLSPAHPSLKRWRCPVAERLYRSCLSLPSSAGLQAAQQERVIRALAEIAG